MARAGTIEALDADYTRTAILKGLPRRTVIWRHVLRNSLLPTIAVIATQTGYLIGGLVVDRDDLQLPGDRPADLPRRDAEGLPGARERRCWSSASSILVATLIADILYSRPQPAHPAGDRANERRRHASAGDRRRRPDGRRAAAGDDARMARRERLRAARALEDVHRRRVIVGFWVLCAIFGELLVPQDPLADRPAQRRCAPPSARPLVRHRPARPRRVLARHRRRARHPDRRARWPRCSARSLGTALGLRDRLLPRRRRRRAEPHHRAFLAHPGRHRRAAGARRARPVEAHGDHRHRPRLRADHRAHGARRRARASASSSTSPRRGCATRARRTSCSRRSCRTSWGRSWSSSPCASATRSSPSRRCASSASASSRRRRTGACRSSSNYGLIGGGFWWPVLFPALAIAILVIGVNLIADGVAQAFER